MSRASTDRTDLQSLRALFPHCPPALVIPTCLYGRDWHFERSRLQTERKYFQRRSGTFQIDKLIGMLKQSELERLKERRNDLKRPKRKAGEMAKIIARKNKFESNILHSEHRESNAPKFTLKLRTLFELGLLAG